MDWEARIEDKIDRMQDKLAIIETTLARNTGSLEEHMRRTTAAEKNVERIQEVLIPIQTHVANVHGVLKLFGIISLLTTIIVSILQISSYF